MQKLTTPKVPREWQVLRPGEFMFSSKAFHELKIIAAMLKKTHGVTVSLVPSRGGYHVRCESVKAAKK